jgi:hypothetical protein
MSLFRCSGHTKVSVQVRGFVCEYFVAKIRFHSEELLAPRSSPKLENHPLRAVRDRLFNISAATLHNGGRSSIHTQPEDVPCRGDGPTHNMDRIFIAVQMFQIKSEEQTEHVIMFYTLPVSCAVLDTVQYKSERTKTVAPHIHVRTLLILLD